MSHCSYIFFSCLIQNSILSEYFMIHYGSKVEEICGSEKSFSLTSQDYIHQKVINIRFVALMIELHRILNKLKRSLEVIKFDSA